MGISQMRLHAHHCGLNLGVQASWRLEEAQTIRRAQEAALRGVHIPSDNKRSQVPVHPWPTL